VARSQTLFVDGVQWRQVSQLATAGPTDRVYTIDDATGRVTFGDGVHGAIPHTQSQIALTYQSAQHDGFIQFYRAMKAVNPNIAVCSDAENEAFFQAMGTTSPYDCVSWHIALYDGYPPKTLPDTEFMDAELLAPIVQSADEAAGQQLVDRYAGHRVPVLPTAYGHLAGNEPHDLPKLHLSLIDGLVQADQLEQWIARGVVVADRYQLIDESFAPGGAPAVIGNRQAADNVLIASDGAGRFVATPDGLAIGLLSQLAGTQPITVTADRNPTTPLQDGKTLPALSIAATRNATGATLDLVVVNQNLTDNVTAAIELDGLTHGPTAQVSTLDAPTATSFDTPEQPNIVHTTTARQPVGQGVFDHTFPAHSVTLVQLSNVTNRSG
jgi:alpha-N-arabinofuranosidase